MPGSLRTGQSALAADAALLLAHVPSRRAAQTSAQNNAKIHLEEIPSGSERVKAQARSWPSTSTCAVQALAQMSLGTSEPLRVVLDGAQSRAVPQATVDHRINGQEVRDRGCKQAPL